MFWDVVAGWSGVPFRTLTQHGTRGDWRSAGSYECSGSTSSSWRETMDVMTLVSLE